jgi:hypothetical protein
MIKKITLTTLFLFISLNLNAKDESIYWVGGSGEWSAFFDHWAKASGGDPREFGKVPDAGDTVYFDDRSFLPGEETLEVFINENAECFTLDFSKTQKKVIVNKSNNAALKIYGSLILNSQVDFNANSISFEATEQGQIIKSSARKLPHLVFNGLNGGWDIIGSLECADINHNNGSINTKGEDIICNRYKGTSNSDRELFLNNSTITLIGNNWNANGSYKTYDAGRSEIYINGTSPSFYSGNNDHYDLYFMAETGQAYLYDRCSFNKVHFFSNGYINAGSTFDTLIFSPGYFYSLSTGGKHKINEHLSAIGECDGYIIISSNLDDESAIISKDGNPIEMEYVILEDLTAEGTASFNAINSIGLRNNIGFDISGPLPRNLYWVGNGKGYWDDTANWSETENGSGGACLPTPVDDINFQGLSSSDTVVIREIQNLCKSMIWSDTQGSPIFTNEQNYPISIYGSLILSPDMIWAFNRPVLFKSTKQGNIIETAGHKLNNIAFDGKNGGWGLSGSLECDDINHTRGSFNTNSENIICNKYTGTTYPDRELFLNNSTITLRSNYWYAYGSFKTYDAGTSEIFINGKSPSFHSGGYDHYDLYLTNQNGTAQLHDDCSFNKVHFSSGGILNFNFTFDTLIFSPGYNYSLCAGATQTINEHFSAIGNCTEYIFISSARDGASAFISKDWDDVNMDYVILKDMTAMGTAEFRATNSIDIENNLNFIISGPTPRDLYWVGKGKAYWDDSGSWSETENGSGGACLPTPVDDVFFKGLATSDSVIIRKQLAFCRTMEWSDLNGNPLFKNEQNHIISIYGSLLLDPQIDFQFNKAIIFMSKDQGNRIESARHYLPNIAFNGSNGGWNIISSLECGDINHNNGSINTKGENIICNKYTGASNPDRELILNNSTIILRGSYWSANGSYKTYDAGTSEIFINGVSPQFFSQNNDHYNLYLKATNGTARIYDNSSFNKVHFSSNAYINESISYDTLIFSPGFNYSFKAGSEQRINEYFNCKGNSCFPITIQSTNKDVQASIFKEDGIVSCDFLSLTSIKADGGATFYAGGYSKSIGDKNENWIFQNAPNYVYGFGPDTVLCEGDILQTYNFNGAKEYLWHDGSTESWHIIDRSGLYWVMVRYDDDCEYRDSINIEVVSNAFVDAGEDIYVCEKYTIGNVNAFIKDGIAPYEISWEPRTGIDDPNSSKITIRSDISRKYVLNVKSVNGCYARDTIEYIIIEDSKPKITKDGYYLVSNFKKGNQWLLDGKPIPGAIHQRYFPMKTGVYTLILTNEYGCVSHTSEPYYFYNTDFDKPVLLLGNSEQYPANTIKLPVLVANCSDLQDMGYDEISFDVYYNPSLLYPLDHSSEIISSKEAVFTVNNMPLAPDEDEIIGYIDLYVGLGNSDHCYLSPYNAIANEDTLNIGYVSGRFDLLGICEEGGKRLINPTSSSGIILVKPNPVNSKIEIDFNLSESGFTEIALIWESNYQKKLNFILQMGRYSVA